MNANIWNGVCIRNSLMVSSPPGTVCMCICVCVYACEWVSLMIGISEWLRIICLFVYGCDSEFVCVWVWQREWNSEKAADLCLLNLTIYDPLCTRVFWEFVLKHFQGNSCSAIWRTHRPPRPPISIICTHISSHPSFKCWELQQSSHHNPNIRRLPAVKGGRTIWGQALEWIAAASNNQQGAYWGPNGLPTLSYVLL